MSDEKCPRTGVPKKYCTCVQCATPMTKARTMTNGRTQDHERLACMAADLRAIIARIEKRPGARTSGLENAAREIEWAARAQL